MPPRWELREHLRLAAYVAKWLALCVPLALSVGSAVALFLVSLDLVTTWHWRHPELLWGLPLAGALSGWAYQYLGGNSDRGNNLILEQIHEPGGGVPTRMAPFVLLGTLVTHLFGGSAGREGTAVQMGGSLAATIGRLLGLNPTDTRMFLMAGIAAGFGAVFGTPLAGTVFALEVLARGRLNYHAVVPCLLASVLADQVTLWWGIEHTHYVLDFGRTMATEAMTSGASSHSVSSMMAADSASADIVSDHIASARGVAGMEPLLLVKVALASCLFGLASVLFVGVSHGVQSLARRAITRPWLRPACGGACLVLLAIIVGEPDYLGLGVNAPPDRPLAVTIQSCFHEGGAHWFSWWWKLLFTAVTVGSGFKGGEVTPLFFIGASLGNVLAAILGAPVDLLAALGFVAVFAGATNTPLACTLMAIELFGPGHGELLESGFVVYAALACFLSYFLSGHATIYSAQKNQDDSAST